SRAFFDEVRGGRFQLVTSALVQWEIAPAPAEVRNLFDEMLRLADLVEIPEAAVHLQSAYVDAGIVPQAALTDALHVAVATSVGCSMIISWNFRHIVHFQRIPLYNAVNTLNGYAQIAIYSPLEVISY